MYMFVVFYFSLISGAFEVAFHEEDTFKSAPFFFDGECTEKIGTVAMMRSRGNHWFVEKVNGIWDVVKLQYSNSSLSLFLMINNHGDGDEPALSLKDAVEAVDVLEKRREIDLFIPKLQTECFGWPMTLPSNLDDKHFIVKSYIELNAAQTSDQQDSEQEAELKGVPLQEDVVEMPEINGSLIGDLMAGIKSMGLSLKQSMEEMTHSVLNPTPIVKFNHPFVMHVVDEEQGAETVIYKPLCGMGMEALE